MPFLGLATSGDLTSARDSLSRQIGIAKDLVQRLELQTSAAVETVSRDLVHIKSGPEFAELPAGAAADRLCAHSRIRLWSRCDSHRMPNT
jgi:hypothetical protein